MAVTKRTRFEVLRRDNHSCRYCGATAPDVRLHVDHVTPVALGGTDSPDNLVAACIDCNFGKSSSSPDATLVADVNEDAVRWARAMKRAAEMQEAKASAKRRETEAIEEAFEENFWVPYRINAPHDWIESVYQFHKNGLSYQTLVEVAELACNKPGVTRDGVFKYFCGIAWKKIREQQDIAKELLDAEDAAK